MRFLAALLCSIPAVAEGILVAGNAASGSSDIAPGSMVAISEVFAFSNVTSGDLDPLHAQITLQSQISGLAFPVAILPSSTSYALYGVVPANAPMGAASVILTQGGHDSSFPVDVVSTSPGLFPRYGPAVAQNLSSDAPPSTNGLGNPAVPGQRVTVWGTGLGSSKTGDVVVRIGSADVTPTFAGPSGSPGMDHIDFQLPAGVPVGCYVPVSIRSGAAVSNEVSIAVSLGPGPCQHPFGLSSAEMLTLDRGGSILLGSIRLSQSLAAPELLPLGFDTYEGAAVQFGSQNALSIFSWAQPQGSAAPFGCQIPETPVSYATFDGSTATGDAGAALTLTGPGGSRLNLAKVGAIFLVPSAGGEYSGAPAPASAAAPLFFGSGSWMVSGPGGTVVDAFQQTFALPQLRWLNRDAFAALRRDGDATILWDPHGFSTSDVMTVRLSNTGYPDLSCQTHAFWGQLTLPKTLLEQVQPSTETVLSLTVAPHPARRILFRVPLTGGGTAPAVLDYSFSDTRLVNLQ